MDNINLDIINEDLLIMGSDNEFNDLINEALSNNYNKLASMYQTIKKSCQFSLDEGDDYSIYTPEKLMIDKLKLTNDELDFLKKVMSKSKCCLFHARVYDLYGFNYKGKGRDEHKREAIKIYTSIPIDSQTWHKYGRYYYKRAIALAITLKEKDSLTVHSIKSSLVNAMFSDNVVEFAIPLEIATLLKKHQLIDRELDKKIINLFEQKANFYLNIPYYHFALKYLEYIESHGNKTDKLNSILKIAQSWEKQACESKSGIIQMKYYENAIAAYKRIENKNKSSHGIPDKIKTLENAISEVGIKAVSEMIPVNVGKYDISKEKIDSEKHVSGYASLHDALLMYCNINEIPLNDQILNCAKILERQEKDFQYSNYSYLSSNGRKVATEESQLSKNETLDFDKVVYFNFIAEVTSTARLMPALNVINQQHNISLEQLEEYCQDCKSIPNGRSKIFAKGLHMGFNMDFSSAIHLLLPQWEHLVRELLKSNGYITIYRDDYNGTAELGLSSLLAMIDTEALFDENLLNDMKSILVSKRGANLRNELAHGLLSYEKAISPISVYWWWRSLKLVVECRIN